MADNDKLTDAHFNLDITTYTYLHEDDNIWIVPLTAFWGKTMLYITRIIMIIT